MIIYLCLWLNEKPGLANLLYIDDGKKGMHKSISSILDLEKVEIEVEM